MLWKTGNQAVILTSGSVSEFYKMILVLKTILDICLFWQALRTTCHQNYHKAREAAPLRCTLFWKHGSNT